MPGWDVSDNQLHRSTEHRWTEHSPSFAHSNQKTPIPNLKVHTVYNPSHYHNTKMNAAAAIRANALRGLRPMASRFQPSTLPQITRSFSASARRNYEFIEVSEPRPGVGQSK